MECPNCHHWNEAGARFCEECGFELAEVADAPAQVSVSGGAVPAAPTLSNARNATNNIEGIPAPSPQQLVPMETPPPSPDVYSGARLVLERSGTIFKLGEVTLIGREEPSAHIDFDGYEDGKYISHLHAKISKQGDQYVLEDLGSKNATRVNGAKVQQGQVQPLKQGDKVRFGKIDLIFHER